jgi:pimeloyl-ACP methyl ester carboxylesterase
VLCVAPTGGPGFESPRPTEASGWLKCALGSFRVVLMDQRGTGRSSPVTTNTLAQRGTPQQQALYLSFFRSGHTLCAQRACCRR